MSISRWTAFSGILFVPLLIVGFMMASTDLDTRKDPATKFVSYYSDSGHRAAILVGMYLMVGAAVAFAIFAGGLVARVRTAGGPATPMVASATAFCILLGIAGAVLGWQAGDITFGGDAVPSGELLRTLPELAFPILLIPGAIAAAAFLLTTVYAARACSVLPVWLLGLGLIAAVAMLFAPVFFPIIALPLWVLIASVTILVRERSKTVLHAATLPA